MSRNNGAGRLPSGQLCEELLCKMPEAVARHCRAVARLALEMVDLLAARGVYLDTALIEAAALLHDMERTQPNHALQGAQRLHEMGYETVAQIVKKHHDPDLSPEMDAAKLVYLADKYVMGDKRVTLQERFAHSLNKCKTDEAKTQHQKRYREALQVESLYFQALQGTPPSDQTASDNI